LATSRALRRFSWLDRLVAAFEESDCVARIGALLDRRTVELVSVHALETEGVNEIPAALATSLAKRIDRPEEIRVSGTIVQANSVGHTGASGYQRLAHQAQFVGRVKSGQGYFLVDDFVGQGGTLANLIGFIHSHGGEVLGAAVLTGKPYSAKLAPDELSIQALRNKHGNEFENWWRERFGFGFDCLTRSEARYLEKSPDAHTIRNRLVAAGLAGSA
jgi:hypoxanthine-guanine phosphoribosyltransferase